MNWILIIWLVGSDLTMSSVGGFENINSCHAAAKAVDSEAVYGVRHVCVNAVTGENG